MNATADGYYRLNVQVGENRMDWYFDLAAQVEAARGHAYQLGVRPLIDDRVPAIPQGDFVTDADEFRNGVLGQIMADRDLRLAHSDSLDSLFGERVIEVRNALRAQGWGGDTYDILTKDGARACFMFDHAPRGRNVIGMSVNGIEDTLEMPASEIAAQVTAGAQEHLKRNRRVDVVIVAKDSSEGAYSVAFGEAGHVVETSIQWKPEPSDAETQEVRLRMRRYVRFDGDPYVMSGDTWRDLEDRGDTAALWANLLSGVPFEQAVRQALSRGELAQPSETGELENAQRMAAMHGMKESRVAVQSETLPSIGPVVAITPAYVIQNVGMNSAVLHHIDSFDKLPVMGMRTQIHYGAGKAVVEESRSQSPGISR